MRLKTLYILIFHTIRNSLTFNLHSRSVLSSFFQFASLSALNYRIFLLSLLLAAGVYSASAQDLGGFRSRKLAVADSVQIDTLSVAPSPFYITDSHGRIDSATYQFFPLKALIVFRKKPAVDTLVAHYRPLGISLTRVYQNKPDSLLLDIRPMVPNPFYYKPGQNNESAFFSSSGLNKSGSYSRGIGFGNTQDLTVHSNLNLDLSGHLTDNIQILASISDDNIPIQPDGSTAQIQEFDKVFIKLFNQNSSLIGGDFQLQKPAGYFLNYFKRAQGISGSSRFYTTKQDTSKANYVEVSASAALSKGKFARNQIQGVEGNQGPYKLRGNNNEPFIVVIAGTEKVYIDGQPVQRGQDFDYVIDYNSAEITFTAKQPITKDRRITVEFQYTDLNYARSLFQTSAKFHKQKSDYYLNFYTEQDLKNQPLQQSLTNSEKLLLSSVGDNVSAAAVPGADSVAFSSDEVLYKKVDTLGYSHVYIYSTNSDSAHYRISFSQVNQGEGDYIQSSFSAQGRIFEWIAPDSANGVLVHKGNYIPEKVLPAPKRNRMVTAGVHSHLGSHTEIWSELALSNYDKNTFSSLDSRDNQGYAGHFKLSKIISLGSDSTGWKLQTGGEIEARSVNFTEIERYRPVEFSRNWNLNDSLLNHDQLLASANVQLFTPKAGSAGYTFQSFSSGNAYQGIMNNVNADLHPKGWLLKGTGSYLTSHGPVKTTFIRHQAVLEKSLSFLVLGYQDEQEDNRAFSNAQDSLLLSSYKFFDWQFYVRNADTSKVQYKVYYRQRTDARADSGLLAQSTLSHEFGASTTWQIKNSQQLQLTFSDRRLQIINKELTTQTPENTILGRITYSLRALKGVVTANTFYEIGSGLERKQQFVYISDPTGQGPYTWIDYNGDGIKQLNEFEPARPEDGDRYIRVYTPTDTYVKAFSNQVTQSVNINPGMTWAGKDGFKGFLARFSDQVSLQSQHKTNDGGAQARFYPFQGSLRDTALLSQSVSAINSFFFNRSDSKYGAEYSVTSNAQKLPLTGGYEARNSLMHEVKLRWNITPIYSIVWDEKTGRSSRFSDLITGQNYEIKEWASGPSFSYQPNTTLRISLSGEYDTKNNAADYGGEQANIIKTSLETRYTKLQKGSLTAQFNYIQIRYPSTTNNSLAYEMLDGLQPGKNITWSAGFQRNLGKNLQLTLSYNGRKSENAKAVHQGNVQVRAFF